MYLPSKCRREYCASLRPASSFLLLYKPVCHGKRVFMFKALSDGSNKAAYSQWPDAFDSCLEHLGEGYSTQYASISSCFRTMKVSR